MDRDDIAATSSSCPPPVAAPAAAATPLDSAAAAAAANSAAGASSGSRGPSSRPSSRAPSSQGEVAQDDGGGGPALEAGGVNGQSDQDALTLIGRVRRWHAQGEWGFIFSHCHNCDFFLEGANVEGSDPLAEGDFVKFRASSDKGNSLCVAAARKVDQDEVLRDLQLAAPPPQPWTPAQDAGVQSMLDGHHAQVGGAASSRAMAGPGAGDGMSLHTQHAQGQQYQQLQQPHQQHPGVIGGGGSASRRAQPPPPPPLPPGHTASAAPPGYAPQAYAGYPGYAAEGDRGYDVYQSGEGPPMAHERPALGDELGGPWASQDSVLSMGGLGTRAPMTQQGGQQQLHQPPQQSPQQPPPPAELPSVHQQLAGASLLMEGPPALSGRSQPQAIIGLLGGAGDAPQQRRPQTLRCNRSGPATQIAVEWCQMLRQVMQELQPHGDDVDGHHHAQSAWDTHWAATMWSDNVAAAHGGDAYGVGSGMVNPMSGQMMVMQGGQGVYHHSASGMS